MLRYQLFLVIEVYLFIFNVLYFFLVDLIDIFDIFCNLLFCEYWNIVLIVNICYFFFVDFFLGGGLFEIKLIKLRKKNLNFI